MISPFGPSEASYGFASSAVENRAIPIWCQIILTSSVHTKSRDAFPRILPRCIRALALRSHHMTLQVPSEKVDRVLVLINYGNTTTGIQCAVPIRNFPAISGRCQNLAVGLDELALQHRPISLIDVRDRESPSLIGYSSTEMNFSASAGSASHGKNVRGSSKPLTKASPIFGLLCAATRILTACGGSG